MSRDDKVEQQLPMESRVVALRSDHWSGNRALQQEEELCANNESNTFLLLLPLKNLSFTSFVIV
jgi:hypothetical protein